MPVQDTSRKAYCEIIPRLGPLETKVLKAVGKNPQSCDREIKSITGLEINSVTARRNKLVELGYLRANGTKLSSTGRTVLSWTITQKGIDYLILHE
jgi:predicted HTH transcriptional regulator